MIKLKPTKEYSEVTCFSGLIAAIILVVLVGFESPWWGYLLWIVSVVLAQLCIFNPMWKRIEKEQIR